MLAVPALRTTLDCKDAESWLSAWLDRELADDDRVLLEQHLEGCAACRGKGEMLARLKEALQRGALLQRGAPDTLVDAVKDGLRVERRKEAVWKTARVAAALVFVVGAGALAVQLAPGAFGRGPVEDRLRPVVVESAARHALDVPVDVASPDPTRVAAFLKPRVGHDIVVPRLDAQGFGLLGGRIVDVVNRRAAQLVYMGGLGRRVSVLAVPDPEGRFAATLAAEGGRRSSSADGLPVEIFERGDVVYTIVGDLEAERLGALAASMSGPLLPTPPPAAVQAVTAR